MRFIVTLLCLLAMPNAAMAQLDICPACREISAPYCSPTTFTAITIKENTLGHTINVAYPVLCAPAATAVIRDAVAARLQAFKGIDPDHDVTDFPHKYSFDSDYTVRQAAEGRIASVVIHFSEYTGGAHGNHWQETWIFDMITGRTLTLDDVFANVPTALIKISHLIHPQLAHSLGTMYNETMLTDGIRPTRNNFKRMFMTDTALTFLFAPYQVGPFAAGEQQATLTWDQIHPLLSPDFIAIIKRVNSRICN